MRTKKVLAPPKDINEVINAIGVYDSLSGFNYYTEKSFLQAHKLLMKGLITEPGSYRKQPVGIAKGAKLEHMAPPHEKVPVPDERSFQLFKKS